MSRRLVIIVVVGALVLLWGWLDGPAARQERGMKGAWALKQQLEPRLTADPRFAAVEMGVSTVPALVVHGAVSTETALQDLKAIVVLPADAKYRLHFAVKVDEAAATGPAH